MAMKRRTLLYIVALAVVLPFAQSLRAQGSEDLPVNTSYREYRLEAVHDPNSDLGGPGNISGTTAVPEPAVTMLVCLGGAMLASAVLKGRVARSGK